MESGLESSFAVCLSKQAKRDEPLSFILHNDTLENLGIRGEKNKQTKKESRESARKHQNVPLTTDLNDAYDSTERIQ